jgi:hypothetical protein
MTTRQRWDAGRRITSDWTSFVCALAATTGLSCGVGADEEVKLSSATACTSLIAGSSWWNQPFSAQAERFSVELTATPSASSIDAVVGLGDGSAASFAALAAAVRFNPAGTIDVRSGSSYRADVMHRYQAGVSYRLRLDVDIPTHTYWVWLREASGQYTPLARGYSFRTEQASVTRLSVAAGKIDSATGALEVCAFELPPTTSHGCLVATAGRGFVTTAVPDVTVLGRVDFSVFASAPNLDAVIGLSAGPPARFSDLAAAVRLAPSGNVDVRDGGSYRADLDYPYGLSRRDIHLIADIPTHSYSVIEYTNKIARLYGFRTEQRAVTHLDRLSAIVDGSAGSVAVCRIRGTRSTGIAYSRDGAYTAVPLPNNHALLDDGTSIRRVDATGNTIAQLIGRGALAADAAGNVFTGNVIGTTLMVDKYAPGFDLHWRSTREIGAGSVIRAVASRPDGAVAVALAAPGDPYVTVIVFTVDGFFASQISVPGGLVALDGDEPIVVSNHGDAIEVTKYAASNELLWSRVFAGQAHITTVKVDPLHNVLFGGELETEIDFGGGALPLGRGPDGEANGFVVKLSPRGDHVFSRNVLVMHLTDLASNGSRVVATGIELANWFRSRLVLFDAVGTPIPWTGDTGFHSDLGTGDQVAIGATGRIWWSMKMRPMPGPLAESWSWLLVLSE